jgi:hypothetical protein
MSIHAQRASADLVSRFHATREDQSRRALVDAVTQQPDTTMAELAAFVEQHPELSGMTLDELLARVRRNLKAGQATRKQTLADWLDGVEGSSRGFTKIPAGPSWPETHVSADAARRIRGHEHALAQVLARVTGKARRLGLGVAQTTIYADKISGGDGVMVNFRVGVAGDRQALWDYVAAIEPELPFEVWLTLG